MMGSITQIGFAALATLAFDGDDRLDRDDILANFETRDVEVGLRRETPSDEHSETRQPNQQPSRESLTDSQDIPPSESISDPQPPGSFSTHYCMEGDYLATSCQSIINTVQETREGIFCNIELSQARFTGGAPSSCEEDPDPRPPTDQTDFDLITDTTEEEVITVYEQIPAVIEEEFASLPIDPGEVSFEPDLLGFGYINRHTNIYTTAETQEISTELLETTVEVRVIPIEHHFDYGDGTTRTTADPGGPHTGDVLITDTPTATSHVYQDTGRHPVEISTTFIGEYRIPEAPAPLNSWTPISNTTTIPATPGEADIWRINHRHVAEECQTTTDWGCGGPVELKPGDQPPEIFAEHYDQNGNYIGD